MKSQNILFPANQNELLELRKNLLHAKEAIASISKLKNKLKLIDTTSANLKKEEVIKRDSILSKAREGVLTQTESVNRLFSIPGDHVLLNAKFAKKSVKEYKIANCNEYGLLLMDYFKKNNIFAEIFQIRDHVIVVIGRDPKTLYSDPYSWGNAVVCDFMNENKQYYPASEMDTYCKTFMQDMSKEYPNIYSDYLGEAPVLHFSVYDRCDIDYQLQLIKEAVDKFLIIYKMAQHYQVDQETQDYLNELLESLHEIKPDKTKNDNDVESYLHGIIKGALEELRNIVPKEELKHMQEELIFNLIQHTLQHGTKKIKYELKRNINNTHYGSHSPFIRRLIK